jgi:hypothetical protein
MARIHTTESVAFTPEDLEHNRRGELSPRQRAKERAEQRGCVWRIAAFIGVCALEAVMHFEG